MGMPLPLLRSATPEHSSIRLIAHRDGSLNGGEFHGVFDQIVDDLTDEIGVRLGHHPVGIKALHVDFLSSIGRSNPRKVRQISSCTSTGQGFKGISPPPSGRC